MKKFWTNLVIGTITALLLISCANMQLVTTKHEPAIEELKPGESVIAVLPFEVEILNTRKLAIQLGKEMYSQDLEYGGISNFVKLLVPSQDLLKNYGISKRDLEIIGRDNWITMLQSNDDYELHLFKDFSSKTIKNKSIDEETYAATGYKCIPVDSRKDIISVGSETGADFVLGGKMSVYADLVQVTPRMSENTGEARVEVDVEEHVLVIEVEYTYSLYDAANGSVIADSSSLSPEFTIRNYGKLLGLDIKSKEEVLALIKSNEFPALMAKNTSGSIAQYIPLFREHFVQTVEEVKEEPAQ